MNIQWKPNIFSSLYRGTVRLLSLHLMLLTGMFASFSAGAAGNTDLMWVLDDTGSLFGTDPTGLRYSAVNQLMSKLSDGAVVEKAGLAYFAESATIAVPLTAVSTAATSISSATAGTASSPVRQSFGGVEFYGNAIQGAAAELASHASPSASKVLVMFTDGGSAYTGSYNGVTAVDPVVAAKAAKAQGITVNVVLLGTGTSAPQYITDMVNAGGGKLIMVASASDLLTTLGSTSIINVTPPSTPTEISTEVAKAQVTAVTAQVQRATTIQQAVTIINVLSSIASPRGSMGPPRIAIGGKKNGMAAGGGADQWNAWMNVSRGDINNTFADATSGVDTRFDGHVDNWIGGIDYGINKDLVVGASVGYDRTSLDTFFNNGNLTSKGTMIAPYISYQINDMFSVDAVVGFADGDTDIRTNLAAPATASQDFTRNFAAVNLSAVKWFDAWQVTGKLSYITAEEKLKDYTDSNNLTTQGQTNRLDQLRAGAQVGYWADGIMPYVGLTYINDVNAPSSGINVPTSRDAYSAVIGVNVFGKNLMGSVSYTAEQGRSNSKNNVLMGSLSYRF